MSNEKHPSSEAPATVPVPVKGAAVIALIESAVVLAYSVFLIIRGIVGDKDPSLVFEPGEEGRAAWVGIGTAITLIILFGGVTAAALNMWKGGKWGRGPVFFLQLLLLPPAWYMVKAHAYIPAVLTGIIAVAGILCLIHKESVAWAAGNYTLGKKTN